MYGLYIRYGTKVEVIYYGEDVWSNIEYSVIQRNCVRLWFDYACRLFKGLGNENSTT